MGEVLSEGLKLVGDQESEKKERINALRDAAHIGIADIQVGRYRMIDSLAELNRRLGKLRDDVLS
jgi:antitoxin ParD1/3/4